MQGISNKAALVVIDLETTGLSFGTDRIIEIACIKIDIDGVITEKHTRINPGIPIPKEATEIHGIADADVADKPTFRQISKSLHQFIHGCVIAGYNSNSFDVPMLYMEFFRSGIDWQYGLLIDVCNIYKRKEPRDLPAALKFYCNDEMTQAHSALHDARATMKVFAEQCRRYDMKDENETALYSNYDKPVVDIAGWFDAEHKLAKGKSKGTQDAGFLRWMLTLPDLLPDARKICEKILAQ